MKSKCSIVFYIKENEILVLVYMKNIILLKTL